MWGDNDRMPDSTWLTLLTSSVGGGLVVKLLDYLTETRRRQRERQQTARDLLVKHHDPIAKSADELVGEIRSLAVSDFLDFRVSASQHMTDEELVLRRMAAVYYFVNFWSRIQMLRIEADSLSIAAAPAGSRLQKFIQQLESRAVRIVERTWQRACGEAILFSDSSGRRPLNLFEFVSRIRTDPQFHLWFLPLEQLLAATARDKRIRQRILKYGVVLHALIDTLDAKHVLSNARDPWPNKLSEAVRKELSYGTFRKHLPFVEGYGRYLWPQKKGGPSGLSGRSKERTKLSVGPAKIRS